MNKSKLCSMQEAVSRFVSDGDSVAIEGFTAFICFAAAHEIIRQRKKNLTLCRLTPDLIYDQMVAAGVASKLIFSYLGNPGVGSLHCIRRAVEKGIPMPLEIEESPGCGAVESEWEHPKVAIQISSTRTRHFTIRSLRWAGRFCSKCYILACQRL